MVLYPPPWLVIGSQVGGSLAPTAIALRWAPAAGPLSHGLFVAVTRAILTYPNKGLSKIKYFYVELVYEASTPALIYPLASLS